MVHREDFKGQTKRWGGSVSGGGTYRDRSIVRKGVDKGILKARLRGRPKGKTRVMDRDRPSRRARGRVMGIARIMERELWLKGSGKGWEKE